MNVYQITQIIWAVCGLLTIVLILLHSPKGDGLGGIGGQSQMFTSTKSAENALNRITWGLGIGFITLTVVLSAGWIG
ncbi:MAG: preprotein translocase subunit SecG [Pleurocapsa sp. SU_5_0]|jgi:preprotein translocase subunit SecG|uniref:preprotein translocase subunit SecG n=1 Tax=Pleurocapsa sp. CCALA 161 TaxID=2107688 RepID=UPI000D05C984|nr:preprotein translocase subunit SecG [Pleurocapsa sp. CCALA 161]NJK55240.1 preprotein translocase subunit SecG [Pleurocapsa sp. SU_5_0]NJO97948.1 preprotein translocase subunit SecG [Pleurocapsa sp. CRU_1_2]NJR44426.1 preprotein translocase subunit SecG [Hyellaceae cyanobacterium CSU_1_1]PSB11958.1 preprotein translocase subunit SecG [Pleurocapsa sp. CCALA 161]